MASRILFLFRIFGPKASRTLDNPNSWAFISQWRNYFQQQHEEDVRQEEQFMQELDRHYVTNIHNNNSRTLRPLQLDWLQQEVRQGYLDAIHIAQQQWTTATTTRHDENTASATNTGTHQPHNVQQYNTLAATAIQRDDRTTDHRPAALPSDDIPQEEAWKYLPQ